MKKVKCDFCGVIFERNLSHPGAKNRFCSTTCYGKWQSENRRGENATRWDGGKVKKNCLVCGRSFFISKSKDADRERGKYCCRECYDEAQKIFRKGNGSHFWKGGKEKENALIRKRANYREWRVAVFRRDDYVCQDCGERGGILNAHHIKGFAKYPKLRFAIDNGVTLCESCHKKLHRKIGYEGGI